MNKLLLTSEDEISNLVIEQDTQIVLKLDNCSNDINVIIEDDMCLDLLELGEDVSNRFVFIIKKNARLIYNRAVKNMDDDITINLDGEGASLDLNTSIYNTTKSICKYLIRHNSKSTSSTISNHAINGSKENMDFIVDVHIPNLSTDSKSSQENKIINTSCGKSKILPNLIVDNDDIVASHSAFIGDFDREDIFYMESRGISEDESRKLLYDGFLIGNLNYIDEQEENIKNILF